MNKCHNTWSEVWHTFATCVLDEQFAGLGKHWDLCVTEQLTCPRNNIYLFKQCHFTAKISSSQLILLIKSKPTNVSWAGSSTVGMT